MVQLFLYLLLMANHKSKQWHGRTIERGQLVTSRNELCKNLNMSPRVVRTCMTRLISTNEVTSESTNKYTVITICNYDKYQYCESDNDQQSDQQNDQQATSKRPANDQQTTNRTRMTRMEEYINIKEKPPKGGKKKDAALAATLSRKEVFYQSLVPFVGQYSKDMIMAFFDYWSEMNKSCTKMRYEQQPTWETAKRLATWAKNDNQFKRNYETTKTNRQTNSAAEQRMADAESIIARLVSEEDDAVVE